MGLYGSGVDFSLFETALVRLVDLYFFERSLSFRSFAGNLSVHREASPLAHGRGVSLFTGLEKLNGSFRRQALVIVIVELHHGCIGAGAETFNLQERKKSIGSCFSILNSQMFLNGLLDVFATTDHTGSRSAQLNEVLAHGRAIEHGVKGGNFVDTDGCHLTNLGHLVHGSEGQPAAALALGQVQERDHRCLFVVVRVLAQNVIHALVIFFRKVKVSCRIIVGRFNVLE